MLAPMSFSDQINRAPLPFDAASGDEALAALTTPDSARDLIRGTAGSSPYLKTLIHRWSDWLSEALTQPPEAVFQALLKEVAEIPDGDLGPGLRHAKGRVALWVALADLGGVWPLKKVTGGADGFRRCCCRACADFACGSRNPAGKTAGAGA